MAKIELASTFCQPIITYRKSKNALLKALDIFYAKNVSEQQKAKDR